MPRLVLTPRFRQDIERLKDFLVLQQGDAVAQKVAQTLRAAFRKLQQWPESYACTPQNNGLREMVIPFQSKGYKVLYQFLQASDTVVLLAMKHQLEDDYAATPAD